MDINLLDAVSVTVTVVCEVVVTVTAAVEHGNVTVLGVQVANAPVEHGNVTVDGVQVRAEPPTVSVTVKVEGGAPDCC